MVQLVIYSVDIPVNSCYMLSQLLPPYTHTDRMSGYTSYQENRPGGTHILQYRQQYNNSNVKQAY